MKGEKMRREKVVEYDIQTGARELGWMAFVAYRDGESGQMGITLPWECDLAISPDDRETLHRLGKAIQKAIVAFGERERKRRARNGAGLAKRRKAQKVEGAAK